jgi:tetratricopeptide (TPR) repeat protein
MVVVVKHFMVKPFTKLSTAALVTLSLVSAAGGLLVQGVQARANAVEIAQAGDGGLEISPVQPGNLSSTSLSVEGAKQLMAEAEAAIANQDFATAETKLKAARETLNQLSTYYQELAELFIGVDTQINRSNREKALETAQMRDQASYQLALVYRAQNKSDQAVPLLMEILRSQQPTRDLGQRAYQQLFELGFVSEPYAGRPTTPDSPDAESSNPTTGTSSTSPTPQ